MHRFRSGVEGGWGGQEGLPPGLCPNHRIRQQASSAVHQFHCLQASYLLRCLISFSKRTLFWGSVCLNCIFKLSKDISVSFSRQFALFWICVFRISHGMDENWLIKLACFLPFPWRNSCYQVKLLSVTEIAFFPFLFSYVVYFFFFFPFFEFCVMNFRYILFSA